MARWGEPDIATAGASLSHHSEANTRQHRPPPRHISTEFLPVTQDAGGPRYSPYVRGQHHSPASFPADPPEELPQRTRETVRFHTEEAETPAPSTNEENSNQQLTVQVAGPPPPSANLSPPPEVEMQQIIVRQANEQTIFCTRCGAFECPCTFTPTAPGNACTLDILLEVDQLLSPSSVRYGSSRVPSTQYFISFSDFSHFRVCSYAHW